MQSLQMLTTTFPWWATLLIMLFFVYLAIFGNIDPDFYLPIYHIPMRIFGGILILVIVGFVMPRVRFKMFPPFTSIDAVGTIPDGKVLGILIFALSLVLSIVTWSIYALVRPREQRTSEKNNRSKNEEE